MLSLVTMPILTHLLSPTSYGTAAIAGTFIALISVFALAGMDMSYIRAYHSNTPPAGQAIEIFSWRFALVAGSLSGLILALCWGRLSSFFELPGYLGGLLGAGIVVSLANTMAQTRARLNNRYREMSISIVASGLGTAFISLGVAYWWRQDELPIILSMLAGYLIPVFMLGVPPIRLLLHPSGLRLADRASILRIGLAGTITAPAYWVLSSSDRWFLGYFEDAASVGIYSIGYSVAIMGMMANNAILSVWTPEVTREYESDPSNARHSLGKTAERLFVAYLCVWLAITAVGGDVIRLLAAPAFHEAAGLVPYIAGGVFFHGIIHLANANLLLVKRLDYAMWWWITGGVTCVILNFLLVPWLGRLGAAMTQTVSFALIATGIVIGAQRFYPLQLNWRRLAFGLSITMIMGMTIAQAWAATSIPSLLLKFPIGLLATIVLLKIVAPELLPWIKSRILIFVRLG